MFRLLKKFFKLFKNSENYSVTREIVLIRAGKYRMSGLCWALCVALKDYGMYCEYSHLSKYFPLFTRDNAFAFGAAEDCMYWWPANNWSTGREDFLNWLIEQYKDDQTDLRTIEV